MYFEMCLKEIYTSNLYTVLQMIDINCFYPNIVYIIL